MRISRKKPFSALHLASLLTTTLALLSANSARAASWVFIPKTGDLVEGMDPEQAEISNTGDGTRQPLSALQPAVIESLEQSMTELRVHNADQNSESVAKPDAGLVRPQPNLGP